MATGTVRLHRVLRATSERVYRAFLDPDAMAKWIPPYGFTCKVHHMDAKVGGTYRMSFTNFTTGNGHSFGGEYRELVPFEKVRYTDKFDDPNLSGEMQTTEMKMTMSAQPGTLSRMALHILLLSRPSMSESMDNTPALSSFSPKRRTSMSRSDSRA